MFTLVPIFTSLGIVLDVEALGCSLAGFFKTIYQPSGAEVNNCLAFSTSLVFSNFFVRVLNVTKDSCAEIVTVRGPTQVLILPLV